MNVLKQIDLKLEINVCNAITLFFAGVSMLASFISESAFIHEHINYIMVGCIVAFIFSFTAILARIVVLLRGPTELMKVLKNLDAVQKGMLQYVLDKGVGQSDFIINHPTVLSLAKANLIILFAPMETTQGFEIRERVKKALVKHPELLIDASYDFRTKKQRNRDERKAQNTLNFCVVKDEHTYGPSD